MRPRGRLGGAGRRVDRELHRRDRAAVSPISSRPYETRAYEERLGGGGHRVEAPRTPRGSGRARSARRRSRRSGAPSRARRVRRCGRARARRGTGGGRARASRGRYSRERGPGRRASAPAGAPRRTAGTSRVAGLAGALLVGEPEERAASARPSAFARERRLQVGARGRACRASAKPALEVLGRLRRAESGRSWRSRLADDAAEEGAGGGADERRSR